MEVELHTFLTSALDEGEWSASCPGCFTPRERAPGTQWKGGWVGPRTSLDTCAILLFKFFRLVLHLKKPQL